MKVFAIYGEGVVCCCIFESISSSMILTSRELHEQAMKSQEW
jgi:hypothetical protein